MIPGQRDLSLGGMAKGPWNGVGKPNHRKENWSRRM